MNRRAVVVAIDGPAGVGKSTLARRLAETLDLPYLNTGLMYRAVTLEALREGLDLDDGVALARVARRIRFDLTSTTRPAALLIDGAEPVDELTSTEVEGHVSRVASHPEVRAVLTPEQRRLGRGGGVVEGRDIGSVVFPDATVKVFLVAAADERAARRAREPGRGPGDDVARALEARDAKDAKVNPFVPAPGAILVDTGGRSADAVFKATLRVVRAAIEGRG